MQTKNMLRFLEQHEPKKKGSYQLYASLFSKVVERHCGKHRMYKPWQIGEE